MAKIRGLTSASAVAASLCLLTPAWGAVTYQSGDANWYYLLLGMSSPPDYTLNTGANGDSVYQYGLTCEGDGCDGLPWGGSLLNANWTATVSNATLNYAFNALEGTDSGTVTTNMAVDLFFHTDRTPVVTGRLGVTQTPPGPGCQGCLDSFSWHAETQVDPGGGYDVFLFVNSGASIGYGENVVSDTFQADVGEVPEPASWTMMLMGLAGVGAASRSRRRAVAAGEVL